MNEDLRSRDRKKCQAYFPLLRLLLEAKAKLPPHKGVVFRGVKKNLSGRFKDGSEFYWWSFSSTTMKMDILQSDAFLGRKGPRTMFNITIHSGRDITRYSAFEDKEAEVLLFPGTKLRVMSSLDLGSGLLMVHLEEVKVPVDLVK